MMSHWVQCVGRPRSEISSVMSQCHADLRGLGGKCVCVAPCHWGARNTQTRRVAGERDDWRYRVIGLLLTSDSSVWADRAANYVRDVAVPCGFARPWWEVRLRGAVPLGSAKHAAVNAACRW